MYRAVATGIGIYDSKEFNETKSTKRNTIQETYTN
jgi:hypothetical protein